MTSTTTMAGKCPNCQAEVPDVNIIIRFERDGEPAAYAECPECAEIISPVD